MVASEPRKTESGHAFLLRTGAAGLYWRRGEVLYVWSREAPPAAPGSVVRVIGFLGRPRDPGNPGEFNFPLYLATRGVRYTVSAKAVTSAEAMEGAVGRLAVGRSAAGRFAAVCRRARDALMARVAASLPPEQTALFAGLVFGDTSRIPEDVVRDFRRSGVFHILAVSGSNVAFVAGGFWMVARFLLRLVGWHGRRADRIIWPATAAVLPAYAIMAGLDPSVLRATLMAEAGLVYLWLGRRREVSGPLCLAALVMLSRRPLAILDVGFQLSYAATVGILTTYPLLWRAAGPRLDRLSLPRHLRAPLTTALQVALVSLAAQAAVTPILAGHFGEVSVIGLAANALIVPCSGLALATGLAAGLAGLGGAPGGVVAAPLFLVTSLLLRVTTGSARFLAGAPLASVITGVPSPAFVAAYYLGLAWVVRGARAGRGRARLLRLVVLVLVLSAGGLAVKAWPAPPVVEVTFLDVGQGDAAHILLPEGRSILVDGGPAGAGRRVVAPYLRHRGVSRLDIIFASHLHDDHIGGLVELLADPAFTVGELVVARGALTGERTPLAAALLEAAARRGLTVREVSAGVRLLCGGGLVSLAVLAPPAPGSVGPGADPAEHPGVGATRSSRENNASLVLRLTFDRAAFLLSGDIEREGEQALLAAAAPLESTVLKVTHHGSGYGTGAAFLGAVSPAFAVISVGVNSFGHPSPETEARLDAFGVTCFSTRDDGAVTFRVGASRIAAKTFRSRRHLSGGLDGAGPEPRNRAEPGD
jgi:competence protein ComEC